ncbi:hypothetical protein EVAR_33950_1 [Eumeta japonica]|uniref:Uncharacterized protein n=1 Tax=Eumeta variegata TaxID=151549 RepID=A0A4C1VYM2_EUMVA|nr:hypothetical protein EVAR_33950_1 [Eumeta japonica]
MAAGGGGALARALIAFHLATAHEQRALAKMKKKIITSTSFRDCPDLGRAERQLSSYVMLSSFVSWSAPHFRRRRGRGRPAARGGAGGEGSE